MPTLSAFVLLLSLFGQGLIYSPPHTWLFRGTVSEVRQVHLLGMPAEVANVQAADFSAWVILNLDTETHQLGKIILGSARPGDRVQVSISGPHVLADRIDWKLCPPADGPVCQFGRLYDDGPLSLDWHIPLSPSNEFIHYRHPNPHWSYGLFWKTEKLNLDDNDAPGNSRPRRSPGTPEPGCLALRTGALRAVAGTFADDAACLPFLAEGPIRRSTPGLHAGGNLSLVEHLAAGAGRVGVPAGADGDFLVGNADRQLLFLFE